MSDLGNSIETKIKNTVNHYAIKMVETGEIIKIDDYLAFLAVELFYCESEEPNLPSFNTFAKIIKKFANYKHVKDRLKSYTREAILHAFKKELLEGIKLEDKTKLLEGNKFIIAINGEEITLNKNLFNGYKQAVINTHTFVTYGENEYTEPENSAPTSITSSGNNASHAKPNDIDNEKIKDAVNEITALFKELWNTRKEDSNHPYHIEFNRDIETNHPQYAWQWNFSKKEFDSMKSILKTHKDILVRIDRSSYDNIFCWKLIQLYVSEWYKREYNGITKDENVNAFSSIGISYQEEMPKKTCKHLGINEDYVYQSRVDENGENSTRREWLSTLYVGGGLPLNYLTNKSNQFKATLIQILNQEEYDPNDDYLGELCGNSVVNQSYNARIYNSSEKEASIYDFIQATINQNPPFVVQDFENFITDIRDSTKTQSDVEKFRITINVFKAKKHIIITPKLHLTPEHSINGIHYAISNDRLNKWNVSPGNNFQVIIKSGNNTLCDLRFTKCMRGDYITYPKKDDFDFNITDDSYLHFINDILPSTWTVEVDGKRLSKKAICNPLAEKGFIQLYSRDGSSWCSQSTNSYEHSAVLFDKDRVCPLNDADEVTLKDFHDKPSEKYGWLEFDEKTTLIIDDDEKTTLYNKSGIIIYELESKHNLTGSNDILNLESSGALPYMIHPEDDNAPIHVKLIEVGSKPNFKIELTRKKNGEMQAVTIDSLSCIWYYRYGNSGDFSLLDEHSINKSGYVQLMASISNKKSKIIDCYALPKDATIKNNSHLMSTKFVNFEMGITCNQDGCTTGDNGNTFYWRKTDYENPTVTYDLYDGNGKLSIQLYQPIDALVLKGKKNHQTWAVAQNGFTVPIPIVSINHLRIYKSSNNEEIPIDRIGFLHQAFTAIKDYQFNDSTKSDPRIKVQTFTHEFNVEINKICLEKGNLNFSGLKFVFIPIAKPNEFQIINLKVNDTYYYFDTNNCPEGIIVQDIEDNKIPRYFIKPQYVPKNGEFQVMNSYNRKDKRNERVNGNNSNPNYNRANLFFDVAAKTGMYFGCFDSLLGLICHYNQGQTGLDFDDNAPQKLASFFKEYLIIHKEKIDYASLWRMADEFLFDWTLIPQQVWEDLKIDNDSVKELLRNKPKSANKYDYQTFVSNYGSIQLVKKINTDKKMDQEFNPEFLSIYLRTITNKFGRGQNAINFWKRNISQRLSILRELEKKRVYQYISNYTHQQ